MGQVSALFFEDIFVGMSCESTGRTVTEADIVNFAGISGDFNLLHTDAEYMKSSKFGERIAHGLLVLSIASGLFTRTSFNQKISTNLVAFVKIDDWRFLKPVMIGDTVRVKAEVIKTEKRSESVGDVILRRSVLNQHNVIVQQGETVLLVKTKKRKGEV